MPRKHKDRKKLLVFGLVLIALTITIWLFISGEITAPTKQPDATPPATQDSSPTPTPIVYPVTYTTEQAASLTVVVNKKYKLPSSYQPSVVSVRGGQLRTEAAKALEDLFQTASASGLTPKLISGYRSYTRQQTLYNNYVAQDGQAKADTYSARPGHSEHQTGLAADVDDGGGCSLQICFGKRAFGKWLVNNAASYGFIVRYEEGKEPLTGYQYEPWHLRYVGIEAAKAIKASGKTMDQYYGLQAGDYAQ